MFQVLSFHLHIALSLGFLKIQFIDFISTFRTRTVFLCYCFIVYMCACMRIHACICVYVFSFPYSVCVFVDFFKGFNHFLFQDLCHTLKVYFKVLHLCFDYFGIFRAYYVRVAEL